MCGIKFRKGNENLIKNRLILSQKTILLIENLPEKNLVFGQYFFRCTFYQGNMYIFEISIKRRNIDTPFDIIKE